MDCHSHGTSFWKGGSSPIRRIIFLVGFFLLVIIFLAIFFILEKYWLISLETARRISSLVFPVALIVLVVFLARAMKCLIFFRRSFKNGGERKETGIVV